MNDKNEQSSPKIGSEHLGAMARQGLAELRGAFYNESNVAQPSQLGLYGTKTPGEVMQDRRADERDVDVEEEYSSTLSDTLERAEAMKEPEPEIREPEPEKE